MEKFAILTFSLRATERMPTLSGSRLDAVRPFDSGTEALLSDSVFSSLGNVLPLDRGEVLECAKLTSIMRSAIANLFNEVRLLKGEQTWACVALDLEGTVGNFEIDHILVCRSSKDKAGQVEGDDVLFVVFLLGIVEPIDNRKTFRLDRRFASAGKLWHFLSEIGIRSDRQLEFANRYPPGNYLLPGERLLEGSKNPTQVQNWLIGKNADNANARRASSLICAYLFYSYLLCQRTERLAMSVDVNGEWDMEWRKLILARKKLAEARKHALLKNRATPDSPALPVFWGGSRIYRLEEQLDNIVCLLDELSKTLETQNSYVTARRLRTIEAIILVSTILGLGVALNAIQMPPFYDLSTKNALARMEFWMVFGVVLCMAGVGWGLLVHGRKARTKIVQWLSLSTARKRKP
jgi:hypothetical protein